MLDKVRESCVGSTVVAASAKAPPAPGTTNGVGASHRPAVFLNDIRDLAHKKWEAAGRPPGDCTRSWLEAEQEVREGR